MFVVNSCWRRIFFAATAVFVTQFLTTATSHATCSPSEIPPLAKIDATRPLANRYATLTARAQWIVDERDATAWRQLLADVTSSGDAKLLAATHAGLARALSDEAHTKEALAEAAAAEALARAQHLEHDPAYPLILTQFIFKQINAGHPDAAAPYQQAVVDSAVETFGERALETAEAVSAAGSIDYEAGRDAAALPFSRRRLDIITACLPPQDARVMRGYTSLGNVLAAAGRLEEALPLLFEGARLATENVPEDDGAQGYVLHSLGLNLQVAGRWSEAEAVLRRAADLQGRYHPDDAFSRVRTLSFLARAIDDQGRHAEADALWERALALFPKVQNQAGGLGAAIILRRYADAAELRGDLPTALARRDAALAAMTLPPDHSERAETVMDRARLLAAMGRAQEAKAAGAPALAILRRTLAPGDPRLLGHLASWAAVIAAADGAEAGWQTMAPVAGEIEQLLRDTSLSRSELVNFGPLFSRATSLWVRLCLETGRDSAAFEALQLSGLSRIALARADAAARSAASDPRQRALLDAVQQAGAKRRGLERARLAARDAAASAKTQVALVAADRELADADRALDAAYPGFLQRLRPTAVPLDRYRAALAPGAMLWSPLPVERGTLVVVVTRAGLRWARTGADRHVVDALVARVRASIATPERAYDLAASRGLYAATVPVQLRPLFARHHALRWYAGGALATVPPALFAAPSPRSHPAWVIRDHDVTVLADLTPEHAGDAIVAAPARFLGIGAPQLATAATPVMARKLVLRGARVMTGRDAAPPALPGAARELAAMARLAGAGNAELLMGADATEARLAAMPLARFAVLAFATHGVTAQDVPQLGEPALVLTPGHGDGPAADGLLAASEIARLRLDADWVILSACDSAGGGARGEPAYAGLAAAFTQAGARALLVSHWPVRDDAAARLTVETLRDARAGEPHAVALQHAMLRLMADPKLPGAAHPAVWAPFVLVGK